MGRLDRLGAVISKRIAAEQSIVHTQKKRCARAWTWVLFLLHGAVSCCRCAVANITQAKPQHPTGASDDGCGSMHPTATSLYVQNRRALAPVRLWRTFVVGVKLECIKRDTTGYIHELTLIPGSNQLLGHVGKNSAKTRQGQGGGSPA